MLEPHLILSMGVSYKIVRQGGSGQKLADLLNCSRSSFLLAGDFDLLAVGGGGVP